MEPICALVLTYNRRDILDRCLTAIDNQTRPCDQIIVINNASTDGTEELLEEKWGGKVEILTLSRNLGAAGGFAMGMRVAYQAGVQNLWLMDDDVIPDPTALEKLAEGKAFLNSQDIDPPYICSVIRTPGGLTTNTPGIDLRFNEIWDFNWPLFLEKTIVPVNRGTFCSTLLTRRALEKFGTLISAMFIWGDDVEYTLRASKDVPGYIVGNSKAQHLRKIEADLSIFTETDPVRIGYHFYRTRNLVFLKRKFEDRSDFIDEILLNLKRSLHLLRRGQWRKVAITLKGVWAGLFYNPPPESAAEPFGPKDPLDFDAFMKRYADRRAGITKNSSSIRG